MILAYAIGYLVVGLIVYLIASMRIEFQPPEILFIALFWWVYLLVIVLEGLVRILDRFGD